MALLTTRIVEGIEVVRQGGQDVQCVPTTPTTTLPYLLRNECFRLRAKLRGRSLGLGPHFRDRGVLGVLQARRLRKTETHTEAPALENLSFRGWGS